MPRPIQAGSAYDGLQVTVNEAKFGANSETIEYDPTDTNVSGYLEPLAPITIDIAYTLEAPTMTYSQAWGDVHIITYNNLEYNFQAVGEFVLAHSTYPGNSFDIQMRLTPFNGSSSVSGISEVALQIGTDRVTLDTDRAATVWLNGAASTLTPTDSLLSLAGGSVSELSATTYKVVWNTGETATITLNGSYFSILDGIPTDETGFISGLQGENEGQQNDFQLPDGTVLAQPLSAATLYGEYADAWRVSPATSLFDYGPGQTTATYTDLNFPEAPLNTAALPAAVQAAAAAAVAAAGITDPAIAQAAITDYIATGDPSLIDAAANAQQQAGTTTAAVITPPVTPPPTIAITADATSLPEATSGPTDVGFTITLTEPASTSVTVDYAVVAPNATFLAGSDFGGTLPSGQVTFAAGQTSAPVDIAVPEAALGSRPRRRRGGDGHRDRRNSRLDSRGANGTGQSAARTGIAGHRRVPQRDRWGDAYPVRFGLHPEPGHAAAEPDRPGGECRSRQYRHGAGGLAVRNFQRTHRQWLPGHRRRLAGRDRSRRPLHRAFRRRDHRPAWRPQRNAHVHTARREPQRLSGGTDADHADHRGRDRRDRACVGEHAIDDHFPECPRRDGGEPGRQRQQHGCAAGGRAGYHPDGHRLRDRIGSGHRPCRGRDRHHQPHSRPDDHGRRRAERLCDAERRVG